MTAASLAIKPMSWGSLRDIDEVDPIGDSDAACLKGLYEVLKQHNKQGKFGVTLLHKHFPLGDDEVLLERTDHETRTLVLQPARIDSPEVKKSVQTSWMLIEDGEVVPITRCYKPCH